MANLVEYMFNSKTEPVSDVYEVTVYRDRDGIDWLETPSGSTIESKVIRYQGMRTIYPDGMISEWVEEID